MLSFQPFQLRRSKARLKLSKTPLQVYGCLRPPQNCTQGQHARDAALFRLYLTMLNRLGLVNGSFDLAFGLLGSKLASSCPDIRVSPSCYSPLDSIKAPNTKSDALFLMYLVL